MIRDKVDELKSFFNTFLSDDVCSVCGKTLENDKKVCIQCMFAKEREWQGFKGDRDDA